MASNTEQHRNTQHSNSNNGLILFPSLADQDEGSLVGNLYVYAMWRYPETVFRQSF